MSAGVNFSPNVPNGYRLITEEETQELVGDLTKKLLSSKFLPTINASFEKLWEGQRLITEANEKIEEGNKKIEEGNKKIEVGNKKIEEGHKKLEEGHKKLEEGENLVAQARKSRQEKLTRQFYSIFIFNGKKPIPAGEIDTIFNKYLADGSLAVEKAMPRINSMKAVTQYLADHPAVTACDFRSFPEVNDIPTLAKYLKTSTIKAIAINKLISADAKNSLDEAVTARKGGLKIQYA